MGIATSIGKIFSTAGGGIVNAASEAFQARTKRLQRKEEFEAELHMKRLENVAAGKLNEAQWNLKAIDKAGWRPGFYTIVLSIPLISVFVPFMVPYIEAGFVALEQTPVWYRGLVGASVASAFGIKKLQDYVMDKKYK